MNHHNFFPQSDLFFCMPVDITIAAIEKELKIFNLKLKHAQNSDCIENRQELNFYLNTLIRDLHILNRAFPPLSQEIDLFDVEHEEQ
jgi:hypothetical protein